MCEDPDEWFDDEGAAGADEGADCAAGCDWAGEEGCESPPPPLPLPGAGTGTFTAGTSGVWTAGTSGTFTPATSGVWIGGVSGTGTDGVDMDEIGCSGAFAP